MKETKELFETFSSSNPDQFSEMLYPVFPTDMHVSGYGRKKFQARVKMIRLPQIGIFQIQASGFQAHDLGCRDFISFTIPLDGSIEILEKTHYREYTQSQVNAASGDEPIDLKTKKTSCLVLDVDTSYINHISSKLYGSEDPSSFNSIPSFLLQSKEGITLWRFLSSTWTEFCRNSDLLNSASLIQEIQDDLISLLLIAMNPGIDTDISTKNQRLCRQLVSVKAAEEYICANLENPVSVSDIAAAAKLHPRSLFRLFNARHGVGPMTFLKQRRLDAVQRSLMGTYAESDTVTQHAVRFGFHHLGQFSLDYKRAFGESPSETLSR